MMMLKKIISSPQNNKLLTIFNRLKASLCCFSFTNKMGDELTLRTVNSLSTADLRNELLKRKVTPDEPNDVDETKRARVENKFQCGLLVRIRNVPSSYTNCCIEGMTIKRLLKESCTGLKFVDGNESTVILRFANADNASLAFLKLTNREVSLPFDSCGIDIEMLTGNEESDYWCRIFAAKKVESETRRLMLRQLSQILTKERNDKTQPGQKSAFCQECQIPFISKSALQRHMRLHYLGDMTISDKSATEQQLSKLVLPTVYEDEYMKVIEKPQGIATMGSKGEVTIHSSDQLLLYPPNEIYAHKYKKAVPVHRLDKLTGGLLVCSKSKDTERFLKCCFENRLVGKRYRAICPGTISPSTGEITGPIDGKESLTTYAVANVTRSNRFGWITTVDLWPRTGRMHQLYHSKKYLNEICIMR